MNSVFKTTAFALFKAALCHATLFALAFGLNASVAFAQASPHANHHAASQGAAKPPVQRTVRPFDETTWAHALQHGPRPAAYLFTTSYCSTCPAAFAVLHKAVQERKKKSQGQIELNAVMMDVAGPQALRHATHFKGMTQMYALDGFEPAIRQAVDPAWPNVTPYVVLVDAQGQTQRVIGPPTAVMLKRWLSPS